MSIFAWTNAPVPLYPVEEKSTTETRWGNELILVRPSAAYRRIATGICGNSGHASQHKNGHMTGRNHKKKVGSHGGSQIRWSFDWSQPVAMTITIDGEARSFGSMSEPGSGNLWLKFGDLITWSTLESINQLACWLLIRETQNHQNLKVSAPRCVLPLPCWYLQKNRKV